MNGIINGELFSNSEFISHANIFEINLENKKIIIVPKNKDRILIFNPNENLLLKFESNNFLNQFEIKFSSLKELGKKIYYIFEIIHNITENERADATLIKYQALFSNSSQYELAEVSFSDNENIHLYSKSPVLSREVEVFYGMKKFNYSFFGRIIWSKKTKDQFIYGLTFLNK